MIVLRRVLMIVFAAAYLALCPALVFHVLKILRTGLIEIDSEPKAAAVTLNAKPLDGATPLTIPDLSPGSYELSVSSPGYRTWRQLVTVKEGRATVLDHVLLLPDTLEVRELTEAGFERLIEMDRVPFLILAGSDTAATWRIFDMKTKTLRPILPANSRLADSKVEDVFTVSGSPQIVLRVTHEGTTRFLLENLTTQSSRIEDLTSHFPEPPTRLLWDESAANILFSFRGGNVRKIDLRLGKDDPNFGQEWRGLGVFNRRVFHLDRRGRLTSTEFDQSSEETLFDDPKASRDIFGENGVFSIWSLDSETLLFLGSKGRLCQNAVPNVLVEEGVRGVRADAKSSWALVWTARKLGMIEISTEAPADQGRFQKGRQVTWVFENAKDITNAWTIDDGSNAVVQDGDRLFLLELFAGVQARPREIAAVKPGTGAHCDDQQGVMYALEPKLGRLVSIRIAPSRSSTAPNPTRRPP